MPAADGSIDQSPALTGEQRAALRRVVGIIRRIAERAATEGGETTPSSSRRPESLRPEPQSTGSVDLG